MVRYKNRYIVAEIHPEKELPKFTEYKINEAVLSSAIRAKIQQLYGDFGCAAVCSGFVVKYWNAQLRTVLIRARHGPHKFVTSSLPFVNRISDKRVSINMLYLGATMRNCFKFLIKYHTDKASLLLKDLKGSDQYDQLHKAITLVQCTDLIP